MEEKPGTNPAHWELEDVDPEKAAKLKLMLNEIMDPEIALSVIQLGLIRNVRYGENKAIVTMILTTPFCPYGPSLMEATRAKAEEALQMPTLIELGMDVWDFAMAEEGIDMDWGLY